MGATASLSIQAASLFTSVQGQRQQANATVAEGAYAKAGSDLMALDAVARGDQAANRVGLETRGLIGAEKASAGASGVDVNSGSAADVQADSARMGAMDQLTLKNNAAREAWGFRTQGTLQQQAANNSADAQRAHATSTLLTGAASLYDAWSKNPPSFGRRAPSTIPPNSTPESGS